MFIPSHTLQLNRLYIGASAAGFRTEVPLVLRDRYANKISPEPVV